MDHLQRTQLYHHWKKKLFPEGSLRRKFYDRYGRKKIMALRSFLRKNHAHNNYIKWIAQHEPTAEKLNTLRTEQRKWKDQPSITLVLQVQKNDRAMLKACIQSIQKQIYNKWTLLIITDSSNKKYIENVIKKSVQYDQRIKITTEDFNTVLQGIKNSIIGFLEADDTLTPWTLFSVGRYAEQKKFDLLYSDEDRITGNKRSNSWFKPDWSAVMFFSYNYIGHCYFISNTILKKNGGFHDEYREAKHYDFILRLTKITDQIVHVPEVLYHCMHKKLPNQKQEKAALNTHVQSLDASVEEGYFSHSYRVKYALKTQEKVSMIIPTKDSPLLRKCISSILAKTTYKNYEIFIVQNQTTSHAALQYFESIKKHPNITILSYNKPFNYSAINNMAVKYAKGEYLLFLNDDVEVINQEWLSAMMEYAQQKMVGGVGAKLYYPNKTIQHAGVIIGIRSVAGHSHRFASYKSHGYNGRIDVAQNLSAITAACLLVKKKLFNDINGFDEKLAVAFNDVDLCLKIRATGYQIIYTPFAKLWHYEGVSRGKDDTEEKKKRFAGEVAFFQQKWKTVLTNGDPYYNPNLTLEEEDFSLKI